MYEKITKIEKLPLSNTHTCEFLYEIKLKNIYFLKSTLYIINVIVVYISIA